MDFTDDSLKDWEETLKPFRFLFRNEERLLKSGRLTESEFLEDFFDAVLDACAMLYDKKGMQQAGLPCRVKVRAAGGRPFARRCRFQCQHLYIQGITL